MKKFLIRLCAGVMLLTLFAPALAQADIPTSPNDPAYYGPNNPTGSITGFGNTSSTLSPTGAGPAGANTTPPPQGTDDIGCTSAIVPGSGVNTGMAVAICASSFVYAIFVGLGSWVANIAAYIFDYAAYLALNSGAYALDFIATGWSVVRDVANMTFLFILVYIGLKVLFNAETAGTIRLLVGVIVMALLVNFSFLLTRLVVDAGNIVAVQFYNAIAAQAPTIGQSAAAGGSVVPVGGTTKDITASIMNALSPQTLIGSGTSGGSFKSFVSNPNNSPMYYLIVSLVVYILTGVALFMTAMTFLFVAVKFILRIVGLWFVIIFSPAAFVAAIFRGEKKSRISKLFKDWLGYLIKFSFYPAVFLFMFYIDIKFMSEMQNAQLFNNILESTSTTTGQSWAAIAQAAANVGVRLGFILSTLYLSLRVADWAVQEGFDASGLALDTIGGGILRGGLRLGGRGLVAVGNSRERMWNNLNNKDWERESRKTAVGNLYSAAYREKESTKRGVRGLYTAKVDEDISKRARAREAASGLTKAASRETEAKAAAVGGLYEAKTGEDIAQRQKDRSAASGLFQAARRESEARSRSMNQSQVSNAAPQTTVAPVNIAAQNAIQSLNKQAQEAKAKNSAQGKQEVRAPLPIDRAQNTAGSVVPQPYSAPTTQQQAAAPIAEMGELKEAIRGLRETTETFASAIKGVKPMPEKVVVQTVATPSGSSVVSVHTDLSTENVDLLAKKLGPKLVKFLPNDGPGGPAPAAPGAAKPVPPKQEQELNTERPMSEAAE